MRILIRFALGALLKTSLQPKADLAFRRPRMDTQLLFSCQCVLRRERCPQIDSCLQVHAHAFLRRNRGFGARQHGAFVPREDSRVRIHIFPSLSRFLRFFNSRYPCSYARQLPLWSEKAQPRYIMNACEIEGGRAFAFCAPLPPLSALLVYAISIK